MSEDVSRANTEDYKAFREHKIGTYAVAESIEIAWMAEYLAIKGLAVVKDDAGGYILFYGLDYLAPDTKLKSTNYRDALIEMVAIVDGRGNDVHSD